jgi:FHA domain
MTDDEGKTRIIRRSDLPWGSTQLNNPLPPPPADTRMDTISMDETRKLSRPETPVASGGESGDKTVLFRPSSAALPSPAAATPADPMADPVAGWLVIVDGPGRGASVKVGYHVNSLGRDTNNRIPLNYGDNGISREKHVEVIYDPLGKLFYARPSGGTNLAYVDGKPLLAPVELKAGDVLRLGQTFLRFVPFCGPDFDWDSAEKKAENAKA